MPGELLINPPAAYPTWVWLLGLVLVLAGIAGPLAARWASREKSPAYGLELVRGEALADLDAVVAAHESGELEPTDAYARLSAVVREFAGTASDEPVEGLTLAELTARAEATPALRPVAELVAEVYPLAFAGRPGRAVAEVADSAREVVRSWS